MSDPLPMDWKAQAPKRTGGPRYQATCKTIRALVADHGLDDQVHAMLISQARQLAATLDCAEGWKGHRPQRGDAQAALEAQFTEVRRDLMAACETEADEFAAFLGSLTPSTADHVPSEP